MKIKFLLILISMILIYSKVKSQSEIPIIHSEIDIIDIRDGNEFIKGNWSLAPEVKPDIYTSNRVGDFVTFYTDKDSIRYKIHPDSIFDFIILLNNRDSAFTQIRYSPTYLDILKKAVDYDDSDFVNMPNFYYQDSLDLNLRSLRKEFNLDSIAGGGNEVSKIINMMHWIHDLIPHDGNHENPIIKNAMSMIAECKKSERGLNCRGLATVLNECYLAMGIKSRYVTCMPKDSIFNDCHVINMVFSEQLNKWIWIDPTHDSYLMDENGELLGLSEVREKLINEKTIILNPEANWNHQSSTIKEYYLLKYMAKNLYRFRCPLRSEYDYETIEKGKILEYVELIPLDGFNQAPKISERTYEQSELTYKTYKTNNPDRYWINPE